MTAENQDNTEHSETSGPDNDLPLIEDASTVDEPVEDVVEDDPESLDGAARAFESDAADDGEQEAPALEAEARVVSRDDTSDTDAIADDEKPTPVGEAKPENQNWSDEVSAQKIAVELKHIETEVRQRLDGRDTRRKRKLGGSRRWRELEEDIIAWRFSGKIDDPTLKRLHELIGRRHFLFNRLSFLAGTRPTWNS